MLKPKQCLVTVLVLIATLAITVADALLPQDIETDFLYSLPILLCFRTGWSQLPFLIAAIGVAWTLAVDIDLALTLPELPATFVVNTINDLFGIISVVALAMFVSHRMKQERDLHSIIRFIDGRLRPDDAVRLHHMREMKRMMTVDDDDRRPPSGLHGPTERRAARSHP